MFVPGVKTFVCGLVGGLYLAVASVADAQNLGQRPPQAGQGQVQPQWGQGGGVQPQPQGNQGGGRQQWNFIGVWYCTVNAQSNDPSGNYGLEVQVQINPDRTLFARGVVIYPQLRNNIQNVEGYGDWSILPAGTEAPHDILKMRMQPRTHPIITWFVGNNGPGRMYNLFQNSQNGRSVQVETQCQKTG